MYLSLSLSLFLSLSLSLSLYLSLFCVVFTENGRYTDSTVKSPVETLTLLLPGHCDTKELPVERECKGDILATFYLLTFTKRLLDVI